MYSGAFLTVTVLTSVLPKTTCPASPSLSIIVSWVTPEADSDRLWRSILGICPWGRKKRNQEGRRSGAGRQAHPACMTQNDLLELSWIGLRWPGLFIPACSVFGCITWGRAWILEQSSLEHRQPLKGLRAASACCNTPSGQDTKSFSEEGPGWQAAMSALCIRNHSAIVIYTVTWTKLECL